MVRAARHAMIILAVVGIYPMVFPLFEKVGKGK